MHLSNMKVLIAKRVLGLWILKGVITFLVIILVSYLAQIVLKSIPFPITTVGIKNIDISSQSRIFSSLFLTAIVIVFFFPSLLNNLYSILRSFQSNFLILRLRLLNPGIFHKGFQMASLITFYKLFAINNMLVHFPEYEGGQEANISLNINRFLYQLFLIVQFLAALFYLSFN